MGRSFVSRAGLKLEHAFREFAFDVTGLACADFGCNVGGFTDCLLQRGAAKVYAIDTGYGVLDYRLRTDSRVVVMERANALHVEPPDVEDAPDERHPHPRPLSQRERGVDLVVIDLAWTPQRLSIPAARRWLKPDGRIVTLVKPHYELTEREKRELMTDGFLTPDHAPAVLDRVIAQMPELGVRVLNQTQSPLTGGKSSRRKRAVAGAHGNVEYLLLLEPV